MAKAYALNEHDLEVLQDLLAEHRRRLQGPTGRPGVPQPPLATAPEVYIALTPTGGIAALSQGSDTGTGTGTGTAGVGDDVPGAAECAFYRIARTGGGYRLERFGRTELVFNLSTVAVPGSVWVGVLRDKWGSWFIPPAPLPFAPCP